MPSFLIIEKNGNIKEATIKNIVKEELYKKSGLKTPEGFQQYTVWDVQYNSKKYSIGLYGKITGRANAENKYDFPPPVDNTLFFGNCILINEDLKENLTSQLWEGIYEQLFGGFEDLEEDEDDDEDDDDDPDIEKTKEGYAKDGFIVDDEEDEEEEEEEDEDEEEDDDDGDNELVYKKKSISKKTPKKTAKQLKLLFEENLEKEDAKYLDCTSELSEESYLE
jgi:hypothetical protein